jgi:hypothetical protein
MPRSYILQSWKGMVQGPSIDERRRLFEEHTRSIRRTTQDGPSDKANTEPPEAANLHEVQNAYVDRFIDGTGSESDDEWYSLTQA